MKKSFYACLIVGLMVMACGQKQPSKEEPLDMGNTHQNAPGDSALYGLACDGCTDSILVFLPYSGSDLDTFDIITAHQQHRIYGRPHIGDELAVIVNPEAPDEALMVIDLESLKGEWCYMVTPTLRNIDQMPQRMQRRMIERMPDSIRQQLMTPLEYTLRLKRDNTAMHIGQRRLQTTTEDMSPVEYPAVKHYTEWRLCNGLLILKADTISGFTKEGDKPVTDTVTIRLLMNDSLVLQFADHEQSFYRKP